MHIYVYILLLITAVNEVEAQTLDLSQPWESSEDFIFLNQLEHVIVENIEPLPNIAGILISKNGKIIFENYYNGSYMDEIYPI